MNWSMPRPVLQGAAALIVLASLSSFTLGVLTAPSRGRLPGERLDGVTGQPIQAQEAKPLVDERIEGAPPPVELTEEEKARLEEEKKAKAAAVALAKAEAEKGAPVGPEAVLPIPAPPPEKLPAEKAPAQPRPEDPPF